MLGIVCSRQCGFSLDEEHITFMLLMTIIASEKNNLSSFSDHMRPCLQQQRHIRQRNAIKSWRDKCALIHEGCFIDKSSKGKVKDKWIIFTAGRVSNGNYHKNYKGHTWTAKALIPL